MTTITTKQGNTIVLEISSCAVYAKINNNAYKVDSFDYVSGKVALVGCNDKFILGEVDKVILASKKIGRAHV